MLLNDDQELFNLYDQGHQLLPLKSGGQKKKPSTFIIQYIVKLKL